MTVSELRVILEHLPDYMEVIIEKDAEGNSYSPLSGVDAGAVYVPTSTWSGEIYQMDQTAEQYDISEEEWQRLLESPRALILSPVN